MTIVRSKAPGWGVGDTVTSGEQNQVDLNTTYALDKRDGETDDIESVVSHVGEGRFLPSRAVASNTNATILAGAGNLVTQVTTAVTANRTYTLGSSGAETNDVLTFFCDPAFGFEISFVDSGDLDEILFVLGNTGASDGTWVQLLFISGTWRVFKKGAVRKGVANGVAPLNSLSKVPTNNITNAVVGTYVAVAGDPFGGDPGSEVGGSFSSSTSGSMASSGLVAINAVALETGDIIRARAYVLGSISSEGIGEWQIGVNGVGQTQSFMTLSAAGSGSLVCRCAVPSSGSYTVALLHRNRNIDGEDVIGTINTLKGSWLEAEVIRP